MGDRDGSSAVRNNTDRRPTLGRQNPETSDVSAQRVSRFLESNFCVIDECGANTHNLRWALRKRNNNRKRVLPRVRVGRIKRDRQGSR